MAWNQHCQDCLHSGYVCSAHQSKATYSESIPSVEEPTPYRYVGPKCECGSKTVGYKDYTPFHSFWCPVWRKAE